MNRLQGKVAFVTGAGGGIGRAICERFLAEGAAVIATDIHLQSALQALAGSPPERSMALQCDVSDSLALKEAIAAGARQFGKINVLCNLAGGSSPADNMVTEAPDDEFWRVMRLDLFGTFAGCKHGIPELIRAGGGSVINITSVLAYKAYPGKDCYTTAKGGIISLTRSMAAEYAPHLIRVNAIAPGITLTPRVMSRMGNPGEARSQLEANHLLGLVEPVDVAHMAVFLASDESRRVTGQTLSVDSGATAV